MAIGRISGPLLAKNLLRDGVDLAFETDLLYLDVKNGRIGVRKSNPAYELDVNGTINADNLRVTYTGPGTGQATIGKLTINSGTISTTAGPITIDPLGNENIRLVGDTTVAGNFHATGNISADGNIILGNTVTDIVVFESEIESNIVPATAGAYNLGSEDKAWATAYVDTIVANALTSKQGNISIDPAGGLLEINGNIRATGRNPIGTAPVVTNVLYVTMDGNDTNDGRAMDPSRACRTIGGAIRSPYYRPGTLIRVSSGRYLEDNPLLLQPNTAVIGDDLRTTSIEPINKTQDLFHVQSGCYLAQMQFSNGRSGLLPGSYAKGSNRGAYATAYPPLVNGKKIDVYQSPYIQNCTNQSGPWLIDGTLFVPNQTIQVPKAVGTTTFPQNTSTIVVTVSTGTLAAGMSITSGEQNQGFFNARTLLLANKDFIKDQVIAFVNTTYPTFEYEQAKCARDVGIIIENVAYDATFGGNQKSVEAGLAYYNGVINLIEGQQVQTTAAINYINTLSQYIIQNLPAPILSSATTQVINTNLTDGVVAIEEIESGLKIITTIINSGTNAAPPIFSGQSAETPYVSAEILLQANRTFLQEEVTAWVDAQYPNFPYKRDFCYRDVGLIVDAISQDVIVGGNTKTIEAALSYYTGSKGDSSVAEQAVVNNFDLIRDIILNGPAVAPTPVVGPNLGTGYSNAKDLLIKNKNFVQTEVSAYVRSLFDETFRLTQEQQNLCFRDLGLILEAIAEDTAAGGNANTVAAGLAYYNGMTSLLPGDQPAKTSQALIYMTELCRNIVKNVRSTGLYNITATQILLLPSATIEQANSLTEKINLITDIIAIGPDRVTDPLTPIGLDLTTDVNSINAFNILTANRDFLSAEVTGFVDDVYGKGFEYNADKCIRDTGLIVDSLAFDLLYDSNSQSIFAGLQYYAQGSSSIPGEETTTTNAINYARELAKRVIINDNITALQTATSQVFDLVNPGDAASTLTVETLFNTVTSIISVGTVGITNQIIPNGEISVDSGTVNSYELLQDNKEFIREEVIAWVDEQTGGFEYDRTLCSRDVGLIVDALAQDLLFSTSSQSTFAGLQYWNQAGYTGTVGAQLSTTTNAIEYVRDLAVKIVTGDISGPRYQTAVSQVTTSTVGSVAESQLVYDEFNLIVDIILNGTVGITDKIIPNSLTANTTTTVQAAYQLLQANKYYLQTEAIAFVEAIKTYGFVYDPVKCFRDVGYMVDSVSFDVLYGGNRQAIQSGVYYYGFSNTSSAVPGEQTQVIAAYNYIKDIIPYIVSGQRLPSQYQYNIQQVLSNNVGSASEASTLAGLVDVITNIVNTGPVGTPTPISLSASTDPNVINSSNLLADNREFIRAEVIAYIDSVYPRGFVYDRTKCRRDVEYIIDCVSFDLLHGGNRQSVQAGVYYYGHNSNVSYLTYETTQAIAAYNHIKRISRNIIKGILIVPSVGNTSTQTILGSVATDAEADLIAEDIEIITDIIANGPGNYVREPINLIGNPDPNYTYAYDQLLANREFIQAEVIAYINSNFKDPFVFDKIKCTRDTKLVVDSIALDLIYNGETQSTFAGLQYWSQGSSSIPGEETTTTNAINYAKGLAQALMVTTATVDTVGERFDTIVNIISTGTAGVSDLVIPNGLPIASSELITAYQELISNKTSIQQQTIDWIDSNNPGFTYNTSTCYRDVGYIVDSVAFDLLHGGNRQSVQAGVYYYGFSTSTNIANQIPQSIAAYDYLKTLVKKVVQNQLVTQTYQVVYPQVIIPAYMGVSSAIPGEENVTAAAIDYLNTISQAVISNTPVEIKRSSATQTFYTDFENGGYAGPAIERNYNILKDVIVNGPSVAPQPYAGSGFFATTGVSSNDVRRSPTILAITTQTGNVYTIELSNKTLGAVYNGTLYFGDTNVFPLQDSKVEELSLEYTGDATTWNRRKVDRTGGMGGSLVDGAVVSEISPIQSFVYDAYTQINQGGRGIHIINNGYAQLVSVFTVFCSVGVEVDTGGIASITNSNSNFGDLCLVAKGYGKREFSGTVYNPPFPTYQPNGEYYPNGYYPKNGVVEIYVPDTVDRPHISLVMEVEPPEGQINEQGFPGFLNAVPNMATLTTGTLVIEGIDTTGISIGNELYIRDQFGNTNYVATGTIITDIGYQSITLNKALINGGGDPANANYFTLYACGNAYYTVLSSTVNDSFGRTIGDRVIPADQLTPEIDALTYINTFTAGLMTAASVDPAAISFVGNRIDLIKTIITATNVTAAEAVVPAPVKTGTPPAGASLAISTINDNIDLIVSSTLDYTTSTYTGITVPSGYTDLSDYLSNKCARDIKLILRQLVYDLESGGNYYSVYSGLSYWVRSGTHHIVNLEEGVNNTSLFPDGATVNFYQRSYISASGYLFEYVGAGTNYGALPQRGIADPIQGKEVIQLNNGKVFFTSTDQNGDFRIGPGLVISQATGVLSGRTFTKSLFANLTPFILAIEGGG